MMLPWKKAAKFYRTKYRIRLRKCERQRRQITRLLQSNSDRRQLIKELHRKMAESWNDVNDKLPEMHVPVLVLLEQSQMEITVGDDKEMWPRNPLHYEIGRIVPQFRTERPFWVNNWDYESLEDDNLVVTHWMPLPEVPV